ncbi:MAG: hypothetical protein V4732_20825 [Pseudomonadota bacterium]
MKILLLLIVFTANTAKACSELHWDWNAEKWIKESYAIYQGMVVSISLNEKSIKDGNADPLHAAISLRGERKITFKVFETLKGHSKTIVTGILPECIGGTTEFGDTALLFNIDGKWHIKSMSSRESGSIPNNIFLTLSKIKREQ